MEHAIDKKPRKRDELNFLKTPSPGTEVMKSISR